MGYLEAEAISSPVIDVMNDTNWLKCRNSCISPDCSSFEYIHLNRTCIRKKIAINKRGLHKRKEQNYYLKLIPSGNLKK